MTRRRFISLLRLASLCLLAMLAARLCPQIGAAVFFGWTPLALSMPAFGSTLIACGSCTGSGNNASQTVQIDLSGFSNNVCTNCAAYNGSFVLTFVSSPGGTCTWAKTLSSTCSALTDSGLSTCVNLDSSTADKLTFQVTGGPSFPMQVTLSSAANLHSYVTWLHNFGSGQPCVSPDSYTIAWSADTNCFAHDPGDHQVSCSTTHDSAVATFL